MFGNFSEKIPKFIRSQAFLSTPVVWVAFLSIKRKIFDPGLPSLILFLMTFLLIFNEVVR